MKNIINSLKFLIEKKVLTDDITSLLQFVNNPTITYNANAPLGSFRISYKLDPINEQEPVLYNPPKFKTIAQLKGGFEIVVSNQEQIAAIYKAVLLYIFTEKNINYRFSTKNPKPFDNDLNFIFWCFQKLLSNPTLDPDFLLSKKDTLGEAVTEFDNIPSGFFQPQTKAEVKPVVEPEVETKSEVKKELNSESAVISSSETKPEESSTSPTPETKTETIQQEETNKEEIKLDQSNHDESKLTETAVPKKEVKEETAAESINPNLKKKKWLSRNRNVDSDSQSKNAEEVVSAPVVEEPVVEPVIETAAVDSVIENNSSETEVKENSILSSQEQEKRETDDLIALAKEYGVNSVSISKMENMNSNAAILENSYEPITIDVSAFFKIEDWRF